MVQIKDTVFQSGYPETAKTTTVHVKSKDFSQPISLETPVDEVNRPQHYIHGSMETIDEMVVVFGIEAVTQYCVINAWKYRARAPYKGKQEQDMQKADWYLKKAKELQEKL